MVGLGCQDGEKMLFRCTDTCVKAAIAGPPYTPSVLSTRTTPDDRMREAVELEDNEMIGLVGSRWKRQLAVELVDMVGRGDARLHPYTCPKQHYRLALYYRSIRIL